MTRREYSLDGLDVLGREDEGFEAEVYLWRVKCRVSLVGVTRSIAGRIRTGLTWDGSV